MSYRRAAFAAAVLAAAVLSGCSDTQEEKLPDKPVNELYNDAFDQMLQEDYSKASNGFNEVERQHPYSVWATKAQLMQIYVNYEANKYDDAVAAADRFVELHPGNRDVAYAYYVKAISYYQQIVDIGRDQSTTTEAMKALQEVVDRFPDSKYARDARLKIDLTRDHLAGKEMEIGRFYQQRQLYIAAIGRYRTVISLYQTTSHVPEALARLAECYTALGLPEEAKQNAAVLGYNFPNTEWYKDTYDLVGGTRIAGEKPGWFRQVVDAIF